MAQARPGNDTAAPTVTVDDELTFQTAADVRSKLLSAFGEAPVRVTVDLSGVAGFDLAGVQVLYAAARTAVARGVAFDVAYGDNEERFRKFYHFAGLKPLGTEAST
jgi:anti-anti-sigma regulatory factor